MMEIRICFFLVTCMYFSLAWMNGVAGEYYTNKWMMPVLYGKIKTRSVDRSKNFTYRRPVSTELERTIIGKSYLYKINSTHVIPKEFRLKNLSNYVDAFNDKNWSDMWYMQDYRTKNNQPVLDINVVPVYYDLRITGQNVNIAVVDSGIEWNHPELFPNFSSGISWNYIDGNSDISPKYFTPDIAESHGTKCAGIISMKQNNNLCGIGVAYGAKFGSIKMIDMKLTSKRKAVSLNHVLNYVDIYSCSWGPPDTGYNMDHLHPIVESSLSKGIKQGRNRKGSAYVFACGNGKKLDDNCACDSHVNSIYTIAVAACDDSGHPTIFSERCASIMVTTYVGVGHQKYLVTTDMNVQCTKNFLGTSAAAPVVSSVIGLAYSANSKLHWRDILHLLAWTSQVAPLSDNLGWNRNKAGFYYSVDFGFGLLNAYKLVKEAKTWKNVPTMRSCGVRLSKVKGFYVSKKKGARIIVKSTGCKGKNNEVKFIEQIQLMVTMSYLKRGDIQIAMKSPAGTEVHVLESRINDSYDQGVYRWPFLILAFWGESPLGEFVIDIYDKTGTTNVQGQIVEIALIIHGTKLIPNVYKDGPRPYEDFKLASSGDKPKFLRLSSIRNKYHQMKKRKMGSSNYNNNTLYYYPTAQPFNEYQTYYQYMENYNAMYSNNINTNPNGGNNLLSFLYRSKYET